MHRAQSNRSSLRARPALARVESLETRELLSVVTYDLKTQWSNTVNPNGVWTYRQGSTALPKVAWWQRNLGGFATAQPGWAKSEDGNNRIPFWFKSSATPTFAHDWLAGDIVVHTTDSGNGVGNGPANVIWTAPAGGTISITGGVWMGRDIGRSDHWTLFKNGISLTDGGIASGDAFSRAHPFSLTAGSHGAAAVTNVSVVKGDTIQLRVNVVNANDGGDFVGVNFTVAENVATTGKITGTVMNNATGGRQLTLSSPMAGVKVFVDSKIKNGIFDAGEPTATTSATGAYAISAVPIGAWNVYAIPPATYRSVTVQPVVANVLGNGTATANFELTQTVIISGNIFNDANGNKVKDAGEAGQANVTVYLDLNNNGTFDFVDMRTTTDASGNYSFIVPFGTYVVREVAPSGFAQTTGSKTLTLAKAQVSTGVNLGNKHV